MDNQNNNTNVNDKTNNDGYSFYNEKNDHGFNQKNVTFYQDIDSKNTKVLRMIIIVMSIIIVGIAVTVMFSKMLVKSKPYVNQVNEMMETRNQMLDMRDQMMDKRNRVLNQRNQIRDSI